MTVEKGSSHVSTTRNQWWKTRPAKIAGQIALAIFIVGCVVWFFAFHPYVSTDDARVAMTLVRIAPTGAGGRIEKIVVSEGDKVRKGDTLIGLDHRPAEAQLLRAQAKAKLAELEYKRTQSLAAQKGLPERDVDKAEADARTAEAELKLAEVALENTYLKSPLDSIVVQKLAEEGNILEQGQVALIIADYEHAWVSANIEETYVGLVKVGQPVSIHVDEGGSLKGTVSEIRQAAASQFALIPADNAAGNFTKLVQRIPIKVKLDEAVNRPLRAGQSVEIRIRVR